MGMEWVLARCMDGWWAVCVCVGLKTNCALFGQGSLQSSERVYKFVHTEEDIAPIAVEYVEFNRLSVGKKQRSLGHLTTISSHVSVSF